MEMDIEKAFGSTVRRWREKLKLSQDQLAKRAGLHRTYICDVERGARNVSLKNVKKLADALSIPLATLFGELEPKAAVGTLRADEMVDILLVEDDPDDVVLAEEALKNWNITCRFFVVRDGATALNFVFSSGEFAHRSPRDLPKIILLDISLPKMDGVEVLRRLKGDPRTSGIPVVMLTGSVQERDIAECKRLGVENYIAKPLNLQNFSEVSLRLDVQWAMQGISSRT